MSGYEYAATTGGDFVRGGCGECGMLVDPPMAFHPFLYCQLFKLGVTNPARFLEGQHFIPDPEHWGKDAPAKQRGADAGRRKMVP